jgi:CRP-like cAMP-binding protein
VKVSAENPAFPRLVAGLRTFAPLPAAEAAVLREAIREEKLAPGDKMNPSTIGFVIEGLLRAFYLDSEGRERTMTFWAEDRLVYSLGATRASPGAPADGEVLEDWTVAAVTPARLFTLALPALDKLYQGDPSWNHVGRVFWQQAYREKLARERAFLTLSATDRYREFTREHAAIAARIPLYLVASYLGITPVALSRLRGRKLRSAARSGRR